MILNSKKEIYDGIIKKIIIPQEYDDSFGEFKEDYECNNIWFKVGVNNKEVDVILPKNDYYGNLFVNDKIKLIRNSILYSKDELKEKLLEQVNTYCSYMNKKERNEKYNQMLQNASNCYIVTYDVEKI